MSDIDTDKICSDSQPKLERLRARLAEHGSALVAYSGGVDSSFLLKVAHEVLGERCVALFAVSESVAEREKREALELARTLGVRFVETTSRELDDPRYAANPVDRCYYCKSELFSLCERKREELGLAVVLDGSNADDRGDWRPGAKAAQERRVDSPLAATGFGKAEIRAWSRRLGLPTWDKPPMPCLASRLPYGTPVTAQRLSQVGAAEQGLWDLGLRQVRVRHHGDIARIEVAEDEHAKLLDPELRRRIASAVRSAGFKFVTLDLEPFRSGRMNEAAGVRR